jgi:hypothetical protein
MMVEQYVNKSRTYPMMDFSQVSHYATRWNHELRMSCKIWVCLVKVDQVMYPLSLPSPTVTLSRRASLRI